MAAGLLEGRREQLIRKMDVMMVVAGQPGDPATPPALNDVARPDPARSTIFALSSGRPPAAIAIIRISGPVAFAALSALTGKPPPPARVMTLATIFDPRTGAALDRALVVAFAADASATGETIVELHLHGSSAVVAAVLAALGAMPQLRLALPGEFTRQAFDNRKLDLTEVEGLADLIAATTERQRTHALEAARGGLRDAVGRWRGLVLDMLADAEAELDFAEEQVDVVTTSAIAQHAATLAVIRNEIAAMLGQAHFGERLRDGLTVAIVGAPNVGKSSLLNALANRDVAIVSPLPGTTRDLIELPLTIAGVPLTLIDTAGLRTDASDPAEQEGIVRARQRAAQADLILHVCTTRPVEPLGQVIVNKIDLSGHAAGYFEDALFLAAAKGAGIEILKAWLSDWVDRATSVGEPLLIGGRRQADALEEFDAALADAGCSAELVLEADALQVGLRALGKLSGQYNSEEVLDKVFSRFCIGK